VDLDGRTDLLSHNAATGEWAWSTDFGATWRARTMPATAGDVPLPGLYGAAEGAFGVFNAAHARWRVERFSDGGVVADAPLGAEILDGGVVTAAILPQLGGPDDAGMFYPQYGFYLWTQGGFCASDKEMDGTMEQFSTCPMGRKVLQPNTAVFMLRGLNGY